MGFLVFFFVFCAWLLQFNCHESRLLKRNTPYFINGGTRGRVWVEYMKARRKGLPLQMKTKQSMEMQVVSLVILEISRQ